MKERLDIILVNQGYAPSREKAKAIIMSGCVYVNGQKEDKAGSGFDESKIKLEVRGGSLKYVSRGGLKLEKAISSWQLNLEGAVCMDIGASTGGFTDCMLQNGAVRVYAVDVGHGQLAWKLRNDPRVICMEKTNFRYVTRADIADELDFASVDVSFISLTRILPPALELLRAGGEMVCLIKPQFEAGREKVGKKGVVREPETHREVIRKVVDFAYSIGFEALHLEYSPIKGPEGNIEYLVHLRKRVDEAAALEGDSGELAENQLESAENQVESAENKKETAENQEESGVNPEGILERGLSRETGWSAGIAETVRKAHESLDRPAEQ